MQLITSMPPKMLRFDSSGRDIGREYQLRCIQSWKDGGFSILSVNSVHEQIDTSVRIARVQRDASAITGRPHVFLADMIAVAVQETHGKPFAIANSDLIMRYPLSDVVGSLQPGEFVYSRRIDIDEPHETTGIPYNAGFDFFACHPKDIADIKTKLVFGAPWWDHYLPLTMSRSSRRVRQIHPAALHLKHDERWNWNTWQLLGQTFIAEMAEMSWPNDAYKTHLKRAINRRTGRFLSDVKYSLWKRLPANAGDEPVRMLHRVSQANNLFLDVVSEQ
jgi:hypothetical protein